MRVEIKNATIVDATLTQGDYGYLTVLLLLDYGDYQQGFGNYALYIPDSFRYHKVKSIAGHFIFRCMEIAGVTNWNKLKGKTIRVRTEDDLIVAIGHIIRDDWFCPKADFYNDNKEVGIV